MTLFRSLPRDLIEELGYFILARELRTSLNIRELSNVYRSSLFWKHYFAHKCNLIRSADLINLFRLGFDLKMPYLINISYRRSDSASKLYLERTYRTRLIQIRERQVLEHFICESDWRLKDHAFHDHPLLDEAIKIKNLVFVEYYFTILRQKYLLHPNYSIKSLIEGNIKMYEQEVNNLFAENFFLMYSLKSFVFHVADIIGQLPNPDWKYLALIFDKISYTGANFSRYVLIYATATNNIEFVKLLLDRSILTGLKKAKSIAYKRKYFAIYGLLKEKLMKRQ